MIIDLLSALLELLEEPWFGSYCLIMAGLWALLLFRESSRRERDNNELLNQPTFIFLDAMNRHDEIKRSCDTAESDLRPMPDFCDNPDCDNLHWFDIKNVGNFPANNITISLVLEGEKNFRKMIYGRTMGVRHLQSQESLQFSMRYNSISDLYYEKIKMGGNARFFVFVRYQSGYSGYWYKRIYQIDASKIDRLRIPEIRVGKRYDGTQWARGVDLFYMNEMDYRCQKDVNFIKRLVFHIRSKRKNLSLLQYADYWVSDFYEVSLVGKKLFKVSNKIKKGIHK